MAHTRPTILSRPGKVAMSTNSDNGGTVDDRESGGENRLRELAQLCEHQQQQLRQLGQLLDLQVHDRKLLVLEMHDGFVQECTGALMLLETLAAEVQNQPQRWTQKLLNSIELLRQSLDEARRLMRGILPPDLEKEGLLPPLQDLLAEFQQRLGLNVKFQHSPIVPRLAASAELAIYRVVQEALHNVWKHAQCSMATVALAVDCHEIAVTITDRGVGFNTEAVSPEQQGLAGIAERARLLEGSAQITSAPGEGTRITVRLPRLPPSLDAKSAL